MGLVEAKVPWKSAGIVGLVSLISYHSFRRRIE